jgi:hypothetical protein
MVRESVRVSIKIPLEGMRTSYINSIQTTAVCQGPEVAMAILLRALLTNELLESLSLSQALSAALKELNSMDC